MKRWARERERSERVRMLRRSVFRGGLGFGVAFGGGEGVGAEAFLDFGHHDFIKAASVAGERGSDEAAGDGAELDAVALFEEVHVRAARAWGEAHGSEGEGALGEFLEGVGAALDGGGFGLGFGEETAAVFLLEVGEHGFGEGEGVALFEVTGGAPGAVEAFDAVFLFEIRGQVFGGAEKIGVAGELTGVEVELGIVELEECLRDGGAFRFAGFEGGGGAVGAGGDERGDGEQAVERPREFAEE